MNWSTVKILAAKAKTELEGQIVDGGKLNTGDAPVKTNILPSDVNDIEGILRLVRGILIYGIGVAAVIGVVVAGIMYLTARDNEAQVATAKKRLYEVTLGLILWVAMFSLLNWLVPGGVGL